MTPSDSLYRLIHSLTRSEKAYFKKMCHIFTKTKNNKYIILFDEIIALKNFDDDILKNRLISKGYNFKLSTAKTQLKDLLLKSLRYYHENKKNNTILADYLANTQILFAKGFIEEANKEVKRGIKESIKREDFSSLIEMYGWQLKLLYYSQIPLSKKTKLTKELIMLKQESCQKQMNEITIKENWDTLYLSFLEKGQPSNEMEKRYFIDLINSFQLEKYNTKLESRKSKVHKCNINSLKYYILSDPESQERELNMAIKTSKLDEVIINTDPIMFSSMLANYGIILLKLKKGAEVDKIVDDFLNLSAKYDCFKGAKYEAMTLYFAHILKCQRLVIDNKLTIDNNDFENYINYIENEVLAVKAAKNLKLDLWLAISCTAFKHGDYKLARKYIFMIVNSNYEVGTIDFVRFVRLFLIVVLDKFEDFDYIIAAAKSYKRKMGTDPAFENDQFILDFFYKKYTNKNVSFTNQDEVFERIQKIKNSGFLVYNYLFNFGEYLENYL